MVNEFRIVFDETLLVEFIETESPRKEQASLEIKWKR